jgi:PAS domain S-box-containing protein
MLHNKTAQPYEYRFIAKNGDVIWCMETIVSITYEGKRAVLGGQMNITAQKRAEEALRISEESLRQSEERYRTIIDTIADGYFEVDLAGNITFSNDQHLINSGFTWEEFQGLNYRKYMDSKNAELAYKTYNEVYRTGIPATHIQLEFFTKSGQRKIFENSISLILNTEGEPAGFRCVSRDITEKRQQDVLIFHSQKLESVGQLAAGIAHEINTPIQFVGDNIYFMRDAFRDILSLLSLCGSLENTLHDPSAVHAFVEQVNDKAKEIDMDFLEEEIPKAIQQSLDGLQRVSRIVQAMREFSHPGGEEKIDLDINKAIESTITLTRNEWKYVADLTTALDLDLPPIKGYPADFNQVILNLVVNAAQAVQGKISGQGGEKGRIEISTRQDGDEVEVCIRDTGTGIPPEAQPRIFDPFFTTKEVGKGTGQGLAIARNIIVNKHGGKIYFETKIGEGTAFFIRLPLNTV